MVRGERRLHNDLWLANCRLCCDVDGDTDAKPLAASVLRLPSGVWGERAVTEQLHTLVVSRAHCAPVSRDPSARPRRCAEIARMCPARYIPSSQFQPLGWFFSRAFSCDKPSKAMSKACLSGTNSMQHSKRRKHEQITQIRKEGIRLTSEWNWGLLWTIRLSGNGCWYRSWP
ncbi:hypothetical protein BC628DRAFT_1125297 [Trametes gibbosa]|nr:hypothetical protein BC628DRAFT_1125297 [Trametes gibbosa]